MNCSLWTIRIILVHREQTEYGDSMMTLEQLALNKSKRSVRTPSGVTMSKI